MTDLASLPRDDLEALLAVTRHLAAPFELHEMLGEVAAAARRVLHAERCSVWLHDTAAGELVLELASDLQQARIPLARGLVGACARERTTVNVPDCYADPRFDGATDRRTGYRTRCSLSVPLVDHRGELVGVMQALNKADDSVFDAADVALAEALAAQCAVALSRASLTAEAFKAEQMRQELELAETVQRSAMPHGLPDVPGWDAHAEFHPEAETGGDAWDFALEGGALRLLLADAAGHGIAPALAVTQLQAMLRAAARVGAGLEAAFAAANDLLADTLPDGHFITAFVGEVDAANGRLRFCSGGQAPILVWRAAAARFEAFGPTSFPMGAMALRKPPRAVATVLEPGDVLVLLSDGIFEQENPAGERYGRDRVQALLAGCAGEAAAVQAARLIDDLRAFGGARAQMDDVTLLLLRRLPA